MMPFSIIDTTAKSPKNAAKTTPTLQDREGKVLLTLASLLPLPVRAAPAKWFFRRCRRRVLR
ncbi:MAG: hypothetical protein KAI25_01390, partial [Hyphomicrobiaceae bacterium]|nr:hypothetical protein [Hyphomicrobiaceae bacterium]